MQESSNQGNKMLNAEERAQMHRDVAARANDNAAETAAPPVPFDLFDGADAFERLKELAELITPNDTVRLNDVVHRLHSYAGDEHYAFAKGLYVGALFVLESGGDGDEDSDPLAELEDVTNSPLGPMFTFGPVNTKHNGGAFLLSVVHGFELFNDGTASVYAGDNYYELNAKDAARFVTLMDGQE